MGSIPGQGTRSHMLQLRPSAAKKKKKKVQNVQLEFKMCSFRIMLHNNDNGNITNNNNK